MGRTRKVVKIGLLSSLTTVVGLAATLFQAGPKKVRVNSDPEGAKVYLNDDPVGTTPMTVSLNHKNDAVFRIEKAGYDRVVLTRGKVLSGWFIPHYIFCPGNR